MLVAVAVVVVVVMMMTMMIMMMTTTTTMRMIFLTAIQAIFYFYTHFSGPSVTPNTDAGQTAKDYSNHVIALRAGSTVCVCMQIPALLCERL